MSRMTRPKRSFNNDPPNLRRFRQAVEKLGAGNEGEKVKSEEEHGGLSSDRPTKSRKQRRKEGRQLKKARMNAYIQKKPMPTLPDEDEIRRQKDEKELKRKQKKRRKEKERRKKKKTKETTLEKKDDVRKQGLLEANKLEDKTIRQLEKQMKMNRRKGKGLPKGFADEGLDYILDAVDSEKLSALYSDDANSSDEDDSNSEFDNDDEVSVTKKAKSQSKQMNDEYSDEDEGDDQENVNDDGSDVDEYDDDDGESEIDMSAAGDDDSENDQSENETEDEDEESDGQSKKKSQKLQADPSKKNKGLEKSSESKSKRSVDSDDESSAAELREDIYGRLIDADGKLVGGETSSAYVPPAKRLKLGDVSDKKRVQLERLKKQLKGFINRLSENNMQSIASQIEELYRRNSRAEMNELLEAIFSESYLSTALTPERLSMEAAMMVALLHNNVDTEIGAHIIQGLAVKFDRMVKDGCRGDTKEIDNLMLFLSFLYNFKVFHSTLVFDVLRMLRDAFSEKAIEMILLVLKNTGFSLRKDDAVSLKDVLLSIQNKASSLDTSSFEEKSRVDFMLEIMMAIRNNNMRKIPNYDPSHLEHLKKVLRGLIRGGSSDSQLRITLDDLLQAEEKGKWWIVGSAWTGRDEQKPGTTDVQLGQGASTETYSSDILELARKQRMNTDVRKNVFCIIMTSEDFVDAFEKLLRLGLKNQQEREIVHVIVDCCLQEAAFNKYYGYVLQKFCEYDRRFQMTLQFNVWDKFKDLDSMSQQNKDNLASLLVHLLVSKAMSLSVFKVIEFSELNKVTVRFMRQVIIGILDQPGSDVTEVFMRIASFPKLHTLREGLRLFMQHFLLRKKAKLAVPELAIENISLAERALLSGETQMKF